MTTRIPTPKRESVFGPVGTVTVGIIPTSKQQAGYIMRDIKGLVQCMSYHRLNWLLTDGYLSLSLFRHITAFADMNVMIVGHSKRPRNPFPVKFYRQIEAEMNIEDYIKKNIDWQWDVGKNNVTFKQLRPHRLFPNLDKLQHVQHYHFAKYSKNDLKLHYT